MPRAKNRSQAKRSPAQKAAQQNAARSRASTSNKENIAPPLPRKPGNSTTRPLNSPRKELAEVKQKLQKTQRKARYLKGTVESLRKGVSGLQSSLANAESEANTAKKWAASANSQVTAVRNELNEEIKAHHEAKLELRKQSKTESALIRTLKRRLQRAESSRTRALLRAKERSPTTFRLMNGRAYSVTSRRIARLLATNGCARAKIGPVMTALANSFGAPLKREMSARTVGRAVLEGLVASNVQMGHEIGLSKALTISADGTSNRGVSFDARHVQMRVPDYSARGSLDIQQNSTPKLRLLRVDSVVEHSANAAVNGFMGSINSALNIFNNSPMAQRLSTNVTAEHFLRVLKGMNGDHASKEKSSARGMADLKHQSAIQELGERRISLMQTVGELAHYLLAWNQWKIAKHGGIQEWNKLTELQQSTADKDMMLQIAETLGKDEYSRLSTEERRTLDLFLWAGCCMHKDQNSFQGGNTEMLREWSARQWDPPVLLANKANAATLRHILEPGSSTSATLTEDEQRAFEQSTRGGVKATALAGAVLRNKDDKKGQGDRHSDYFKAHVDKKYTRFPDTSNTRFGSHGDAAADLIRYLDHHIKYFGIVRLSKNAGTFTQIELNVLTALLDIPTRTELCAMVLYHQAVSKPYMSIVRSDSDNVLDLGPLHKFVCEFVQKIISEPDLLFLEFSHVTGTLDGKPWFSPETVDAVKALAPTLEHLRDITIAFFRGTLATWERFSSEFAPGGLIDEASAEEKHAAWMPATNDVNEGALGQYRVIIRGKPSLTLHQYNAMAMFRHNDTQAYMDATFTSDDHLFVMREARKIDASGLEAKRKREIVDYRLKVAQIRQEKEAARLVKLKADAERLSAIHIVSKVEDIFSSKLTVKLLGDQLDALRFRGLPDVPAKSRFSKKADLQQAVKETFLRYQLWLKENNPGTCGINNSMPGITVEDDWEAREEEEMAE